MTTLFFVPARRLHRLAESIPGLLKSLQIQALAGRYYNPITTRFLAPIACLKIKAQGAISILLIS
jgi:hypothetical protein